MDAAGAEIGGALNIVHDDESLPVTFYSCQLRGVEQYRIGSTRIMSILFMP